MKAKRAQAMRARTIAAAGLALAWAGAAQAADAQAIATGRRVFDEQCAACHGMGPGDDGSPTLPGTAALQAKYKGEKPGALERRDDLSAPLLKFFVRNGSGAMPMFRKVEISDAEIEALTAYLADEAAKAGKAGAR